MKVPCGGFELDDSLKIENGKLGIAPGAGNDETEIFKVAITIENDNAISDKTFAEIQEAYQAGKYIYASMDGIVFCSLLVFIKDTAVIFGGLDGSNIYNTFIVTANNDINYERVGVFAPVPNPDANGQFVQVVNGSYELSSDIVIPSSTNGSSKKFKIIVDDSGNLSTTQVT